MGNNTPTSLLRLHDRHNTFCFNSDSRTSGLSTATNQTWVVHYAIPALKLIRIGSVEIHTDLWTHHTPIHWRHGASGHIRLSALRAKSRSFKIFQPNHMQHGCSLITIMSILSGKHHKQTKTKSNEGRTEWGQNKKGSRFLCWRF